MAASLVITNTAREPAVKGDLFAGYKFWIAQRCPSRQDYIKKITYNGGTVVPLEKQADILIVDHMRKDLPVGSISFRFIDESLKDAELKDTNHYVCGPPHHIVRDVSSAKPVRAGRTPFTAQDDIELYDWVKRAERQGIAIKGNELYKQLEQKNPRHSWQSWRDRYIKVLSIKPPSTTLVDANPPPSPPSDPQPTPQNMRRPRDRRPASTGSNIERTVSPQRSSSAALSNKRRLSAPVSTSVQTTPVLDLNGFTLDDFHDLLSVASDIQNVTVGKYKEAWQQWGMERPGHTTEEWRSFYESKVLPIWEALEVDEVREAVYAASWNEWRGKHGMDIPVNTWLQYYHANVVPLFEKSAAPTEKRNRDSAQDDLEQHTASGPNEDQKTDTTGAAGPGGKKTGEEDVIEDSRHAASNISTQTTAVGTKAKEPQSLIPEQLKDGLTNNQHVQEGTPQPILGKRSRDDDDSKEDEGVVRTPSAKRRNTNHHLASEVSLQTAEEDIRQPTHEEIPSSQQQPSQDVIQISSAEPSQSSLQPSTQSDFEPAQKEQYTQLEQVDEEQPEQEEEDDEQMDSGSMVSAERIREVLDGISDEHIEELLGVLRTVPAAPEEPDDMKPFEAVVMHTVHFFKQIKEAESQAVWDVGDTFQRLGLMDRFFDGDEEGEEGDEAADEDQDYQEEDEEEEETSAEADIDGTTKVDIHQDMPSTIARQPSPAPPSSPPPLPSNLSSKPASSQQQQPQKSAKTSTDPSATSTTGILTTATALESYIASRIAPPHRYAEFAVLTALRATSAHADLADVVLRYMRVRDGALPDLPGVWKLQDDEDVVAGEGDQGAGIARVVRKHGAERVRARRGFLKDWGVVE